MTLGTVTRSAAAAACIWCRSYLQTFLFSAVCRVAVVTVAECLDDMGAATGTLAQLHIHTGTGTSGAVWSPSPPQPRWLAAGHQWLPCAHQRQCVPGWCVSWRQPARTSPHLAPGETSTSSVAAGAPRSAALVSYSAALVSYSAALVSSSELQ